MLSDIWHLGFWKDRILMAHRVRNVKMRKRAKFRGNWSEQDRDIAFFLISRWQPSAILDVLKFIILTVDGFEGEHASSCKISWQSVKPLPKYGDFSIFQDSGRRHLGFLIFWKFNGLNAHEGRPTLPCQIWSKSVKLRPRYGDFSRWRPPPSWIFKFFKF